MHKSICHIGAILFTVSLYFTSVTSLNAEEMITPESFTKHITLQPAITILIEEDDVEIALKQLNVSHGKMAEDGWELYDLVEYIDDEDFEGFFVTYKKRKE